MSPRPKGIRNILIHQLFSSAPKWETQSYGLIRTKVMVFQFRKIATERGRWCKCKVFGLGSKFANGLLWNGSIWESGTAQYCHLAH